MNFNKQQKKAIETDAKRILVTAGPGSGKTKVLTERVIRLIKDGSSAYDIALITFTRKSAEEMAKRISETFPESEMRKLTVGTFHSVCLTILKNWGELLGYKTKSLSIYDETDQKDVITSIANSWPGKFKRKNIDKLLLEFSTHGEKLLTYNVKDYPEEVKIIKHYLQVLRENNAIDFGLIITETVRLLENFPQVREHYQNKFKHILIDEFQDTNAIQQKFYNLINPDNLFVVGDPAQSIYKFRGATVDIILDFELDYFDVEVIHLEACYRCSTEIINCANNLIKYNQHRIDKTIIPARKEKGSVSVIAYETPIDMARTLAKIIKSGDMSTNTAILSRTKKALDGIAEMFQAVGVPFVQIGGDSDLYKNPDVKAFHSFLSLVINNGDNLAFMRVKGFFDVNDVLYQQIKYMAVKDELSHMAAWEKLSCRWPITGAMQEFKTSLEKWTQVFSRYFQDSLSFPFVKEKITEYCKENDDDIENYLNWLQTKDIVDTQDDIEPDDNKVKLMTVHAAKGLEFENVVVVGMTEGHLPHKMAKTDADIEEERRLMYVAITRAKNILSLCYAKNRITWNGQPIESEPSKFLEEVKQVF